MKKRDFGLLLILGGLWGASFLFIRIASPILGPFLLVDLRVIISFVALIIYALLIGKRPQLRRYWKEYLLLGTYNAAIPFTLISTAGIYLPASMSAIINSTTPLFTALVAWIWIKEPLTKRKIVGFILGIIGVSILIGFRPVSIDDNVILSSLLIILATISYGVGGVYASKKLQEVTALDLAIGQQLGAGILLFPVAMFNLPTQMPSLEVIYSVMGLALLSTALGYLIYFKLMKEIGPVNTSNVTLLVPVFSIIWGVLFLNEVITIGTIIGLLLILLSIAIATKRISLKRRKGKLV
ncbi:MULTISPECIES: DMT family transporter [Exiguobacterium]|uniref:EamA family transporter n=1 Tax=Exiguobacterium acetylicum TaxID=41170 RepID=A0ABX8GDQ6_EXIAC|nr:MULTISPECIES: DMT family transporter [Exiguobacterium]QWB31789.1 EamA family transporter [Exiguobacterium acetylicum]